MFGEFFFVLENQSHSEDTRRKFSLKIFFFVLENQSHSEDALIADGFMFGYRICGTLSLCCDSREEEKREERGEKFLRKYACTVPQRTHPDTHIHRV
jgi:hypothetical protein